MVYDTFQDCCSCFKGNCFCSLKISCYFYSSGKAFTPYCVFLDSSFMHMRCEFPVVYIGNVMRRLNMLLISTWRHERFSNFQALLNTIHAVSVFVASSEI